MTLSLYTFLGILRSPQGHLTLGYPFSRGGLRSLEGRGEGVCRVDVPLCRAHGHTARIGLLASWRALAAELAPSKRVSIWVFWRLLTSCLVSIDRTKHTTSCRRTDSYGRLRVPAFRHCFASTSSLLWSSNYIYVCWWLTLYPLLSADLLCSIAHTY